MIYPGPPPQRYRPCVGILLINKAGNLFVGERLDTPNAWQMPQGGINAGESAVEAAIRELREETGIYKTKLLGIDKTWRTYNLPERIRRRAWGGEFRGQAQIWTSFSFTGTDADINIATVEPEFRRWKWTDPETLVREVVHFKRNIYRDIITSYPEWEDKVT
ncbi:MAG: RNA pyrophosphohydrolase [Pseudomonadota bacterium]|nr:RNA pyrophosphohydrolase [Pseudomonadota bacterium]MEC8725637.1 RNA pyrophosphohydrolase [Pseudomonadota bacterium]MEC9208768.1 RNA pyrophosphohydrolase [Pseudomonadota bacterium]